MFIKSLLLLTVICSLSLSVNAQEKWKFEIVLVQNAFGPVNTILYMEKAGDSFSFHSTKDADKRILGYPKSLLGRVMGKLPKNGIFVATDKGRIVKDESGLDSLFCTFTMPMVGLAKFKGIMDGISITGNFLINNQIIADLKGQKVEMNDKFNYTGLSAGIIDTTEKYLYSPEILSSRHWKKFTRKLMKLESKAIDDVEFLLGTTMEFAKLPFSHYHMLILDNSIVENAVKPTNNNLSWKEMDSTIAYVEINSFGGERQEMDSVFNEVLEGKYQNLIVDLRNNPGGGIQGGVAFGKYFVKEEVSTGYFVTNKWYSKGGSPDDLESLPPSGANNTVEFINELKQSEGKQLMVRPGDEVFNGKVYVLTSTKTASTCEPIVYVFKAHKLATVVGQKTAGGMLSSTQFNIRDNYWIILPIADYYTPDKTRLDQIGVVPNIEVPSEEALDYVLKMIGDTK